MFVEVIPLRRTPFGLNVFDYRLPEGMEVQIGQLVVVPLRGHPTEALIFRCKETSAFAKRAQEVIRVLPLATHVPPACVELLVWVAERTFSSYPTVAHAWFGALPKRWPKSTSTETQAKIAGETHSTRTGQASAHWTTDHTQALIARARTALAEGKRVLVLTPWTNRVTSFCEAIGSDQSIPLHGDLAAGAYFQNWSAFLHGASRCLVATRLGAWLAPAADLVFIDEPENDDHKQDEQAPRYDARRLAGWAAKYARVDVEAFGLTPPLHATIAAPTIECALQVFPFHPAGRSKIACLQADSLLALHEHEGPRVIIHPIRGMAARYTCRDCGWQAPCETCGAPLSAGSQGAICRSCGKHQGAPLECPTCGSADLGKSTPGIDALKHTWTLSEPTIPVDWRDTTSEALEQPLADGALVVITLSQLIGGYTEDIRHTERRMITIRRLMKRVAEVNGQLIIQSNEQDLALWEAWRTSEGVQQTIEHELTTRRLFRYPPTWRRIKCLIDGTESIAHRWAQAAQSLIKSAGGTLENLAKVSFRRTGSHERWVAHLVFSPEVSEASLIELLQPLAKEALIDLDPIAFFK